MCDGRLLKMHIFYKGEEETERGEKKNTASVCVVSVELTSDLAEYGKEESAESTLWGGGGVCVCFVACMCPHFCVGGTRRE